MSEVVRPTHLAKLDIPMPSAAIESGATKMLEGAKGLVVSSAEEYTAASTILAKIKQRWASVEAERKKVKTPLDAAVQAVQDLFNPPLKAYKDAEAIVKKKLIDYDTEQQRLAEIKRREANAKAEAERKAAEKAAEEKRERMQMALSEIQGIQQQVIIAQGGRLGVRKGGTRECIVETLAETSAWRIEEDHFGEFYASAQSAKSQAISAIQALLLTFDANVAREKAAAEAAEAQKAGNEDAIAKAKEETAAARREAVAARVAALKAEEENQRLLTTQAQQKEATERAAEDLEFQAAATLPAVIETELAKVAGQTRRKLYKFRVTDISKVDRRWLILDEKTVQAMVTAKKDAAQAFLGEGIEVYTEFDISARAAKG